MCIYIKYINPAEGPGHYDAADCAWPVASPMSYDGWPALDLA